ncbi:MAG TPA: HPr family phosphocarrier protein [Caldilineaceae bacterium]|nr:HPr family phosphocarrier protein [Caldilineaceae bacterium]
MQEQTVDVTISNPMGLHLRTGKEVVQVANQFDADITAQNLTRQSPMVNLKSILQIMQLQARQGHTLRLYANGQDAAAALTALTVLFQSIP